ncbi:PD40 domain-containing protein [Kitasatospora albolonga]
MTRTTRLLVLLFAVLLLGGVGTEAVLYAADRADRKDQEQVGGPPVRPGTVTLAGGQGQLLFRNLAWGPHRDEIVTVPAGEPGSTRTSSGLKCLRFHAAAGTGICLQAVHGTLDDTYRAVVLDDRLHELRSFPAAGIPSRARVSPSGRLAAWTVFVSGDSYAGSNFSTRTAIVDTRDWRFESNLEEFAFLVDGRPQRAPTSTSGASPSPTTSTSTPPSPPAAPPTWSGRPDRPHPDLPAPETSSAPRSPPTAPGRLQEARPRRLAGRPLAPVRPRPGHHGRDRHRRAAQHRRPGPLGRRLHPGLLPPGEYGADLWTVPADGTGAPATLAVSAVAPAYLR